MKLLVAVPTRERPLMLADCVRSIFAADIGDHDFELLVIENGSAVSQSTLLSLADAPSRWKVSAIVETRVGVPFVRNTALDRARAVGADGVFFIDDDQTIPSEWFLTLIDAARESRADAVQSVNVFVFDRPSPVDSYFDSRPRALATTDLAPAPTLSTCGVLVLKSIYADSGVRFDERFPLLGSEDTRFFYDAAQLGLRLFITRRTFINEKAPPEKQTMRWLLQRKRMNSFALLIRGVRRDRSDFAIGLEHGWRLLYNVVCLPFAVRSKPSLMRRLMKIAGSLGVLEGLAGRRLEQYSQVVGS